MQGALGLFFYLNSLNKADAIGWLPVTSLVIFIMTYCVGMLYFNLVIIEY